MVKNVTIPTRVLNGASKEQIEIEYQMNKLIAKTNKWALMLAMLTFSVIGIPIALMILLIKGKGITKDYKRIKELNEELRKAMIKNAEK